MLETDICKLKLVSSCIKNQQRFPISKFGWPLKEAAEKIIEGKQGWYKESLEILDNLITKRKNMNNLSDLYGVAELKKWHIDSKFYPWFSEKPILNKSIYDLDYKNAENGVKSIKKICDLLTSFDKNGFKENNKLEKNIIVYPLDLQKNFFYVRAGNHRVATLSALRKKIPCFLDNILYLKPRDKIIISKYLWKINTGILYQNYPNLKSCENWPVVRSKNISIKSAISIKKLFCP